MDLERLRHLNQDLLRRLRTNQEEFRERVRVKLLPPSQRATPQGAWVSDSKGERENRERFPEDSADSAVIVSVEVSPQLARRNFASPLKPALPQDEREGRHRGRLRPTTRETEVMHVPPAAAPARSTRKTAVSGGHPKGPRKPRVTAGHAEAKRRSPYLHSLPETDRPQAREQAGPGRAKEGRGRTTASVRMSPAPKPILLTPQAKESKEKSKKESGHVTFMSDPEECAIPADDWSVRPFLGYDWIAGLLDMDTSLSEKPDQYFSELQEFRKVNREACIYDRDLRSDGLGTSAHNRESDMDSGSHQCVFCYRLNKRLFAVPLDLESACPICKTPRAHRPPESLVEPAFVRVSIPRSTLLPAYKHKIHRRKSYEPADNLALPSHCLAGWQNPVQAFSPTLSSLDLHSSLGDVPLGHTNRIAASRVSGGSRTDELLDLSRVAEFELCNLSWRSKHHKPPCHKATSN
ncbi:migration and invasion-inhibitory protein isoform X1 [Zootoca vivipara]|uniref:migration and invasion-inhibitory protein isoform X1 n=1 Tax=Zootoca vivipara TaxID=8524 RepID=UPI00293B943C|nr:migration and invasion-inhibitory protein isoform X1 [Zootoca vivipara]XP_034976810.2 migration and invasion-inhibitory protein isoform X1 [Zootoca vivipara]